MLRPQRRSSASRFVLRLTTRCLRQLGVERLAVPHAATQEVGPVRNRRKGIGGCRQQAPEFRVMPTELLAGAVAVLPDSFAQSPDLRDQILS